MQDDYGLPGDEPDYEAKYQEERAAKEKLETELAALRSQRGDAAGRSPTATPASPGEAADLDAMLAKVSDRSRAWPEIEAELEAAHGFTGGLRPSQAGLRRA